MDEAWGEDVDRANTHLSQLHRESNNVESHYFLRLTMKTDLNVHIVTKTRL